MQNSQQPTGSGTPTNKCPSTSPPTPTQAGLRQHPYDVIFVDTPGFLDATDMRHTIARTADFMVLPTSTEWLAIRAIIKGIAKVITSNQVPYKVLLNRIDGGAPSEIQDARDLFTSKNIAVFHTPARSYKAIYWLPIQGQLITDLSDTGSEAKAAPD